MPPSGYSVTQSASIRAFLQSCSQALEAESKENCETLPEALRREIDDISIYVGLRPLDTMQHTVLGLTRAFYEAVLSAAPNDTSTFREAVDAALDDIVIGIMAIHIEPGQVRAA